jgi:NosR/NirI family transcriptional regulator, nitrous oxide reductase regulator
VTQARLALRPVFRNALMVFVVLVAMCSAVAAQQGGWNFEDEEEDVPSWSEDVRAQAPDLLAVGGFIAFAFVSFFKKSERLKIAALVGAVAFLGFYKSQLISIVNVFGLFGGNLPIFRQNLSWYLLAVVTIVSTVLWGRVYCGRLCAFGAFTQLLDRVVPARLRVNIPRVLERRASLIKYGILAGAIGYFLLTRDPLFYPYIEPFWMFGLHGKTPALWIALGGLLLASVFVRNVYCRLLCPVGAALGLLSNLTVFRIKRWSECSTCRICEKACEWGAIRGPKIVLSECVRCDDCERLYDDEKKCPHHLIVLYRSRREAALAQGGGVMARPSAAGSSPGGL